MSRRKIRQKLHDQLWAHQFEKSWFEMRPYGTWLPAYVGMGRTPLYGWHVDPWMGREVRRHRTVTPRA